MNWDQFKTILWLRLRLTRHQWSRGKGLNAVVTILVFVALASLGLASFGFALVAGAFLLQDASGATLRWVWLGISASFLLLWFIALVSELQRSETIDLQRLMHLPVRLGQVFTFNYLASHLSFSLFLFVPAMTALAIGLAFSHGAAMLLIIPLAYSLVFSVTAWTYCLRGWLASMMANPRKRRAVIVGMTLFAVLLGQGPNLYFNVFRRFDHPSAGQRRPGMSNAQAQEKLRQFSAVQKYIPPCWVAVGAANLSSGNPFPALAATAGLAALGAVGLRRAYRTTLKFYYGESGAKAPSRPKTQTKPARAKGDRGLVWLRIPGVPEEAAAVAGATLRSLLRAPEVKMTWATSFVATVLVGAGILLRGNTHMSEAAKPFVVVAPLGFSLMLMLQFLNNQFGFDREGFRSLVLSPADRKWILLGKNLAALPVAAVTGLILLSLTAVWLHLPVAGFLAAVFQLLSLILLTASLSNVASILVPYRIQPGSMKPTKTPGASTLLMLAFHLLFPFLLIPVMVPPLLAVLLAQADFPAFIPINLIGCIVLAAIAAAIYWAALGPLSQLLQRREIKILERVTQEIE